jgi:uncharacterized membrane protein
MATKPTGNWHTDHKATLTRGQRAADIMRNGMGSWPFVAGFIGFMIVWAIINSTTARWDPYPFILLNLFLSMLAGLQGAILLIAAKRQDSLTAALADHDYRTNVAAKKDIEALLEINNRQVAMIGELHEVLKNLGVSPAWTVAKPSPTKPVTAAKTAKATKPAKKN